jgi:hypothetical protein
MVSERVLSSTRASASGMAVGEWHIMLRIDMLKEVFKKFLQTLGVELVVAYTLFFSKVMWSAVPSQGSGGG